MKISKIYLFVLAFSLLLSCEKTQMPTYKGEKDVDFHIDWYCDTVRLSSWNWNSSSENMDKWEEGTAIEIPLKGKKIPANSEISPKIEFGKGTNYPKGEVEIEIKDNKMFLKYQKEGYLKVLLEYKDSVFTTINVLNYPHQDVDHKLLFVYWTTCDDFATEKDLTTILNPPVKAIASFYDPDNTSDMEKIYYLHTLGTSYPYEYWLQVSHFFDKVGDEWKLKEGIKTIISPQGISFDGKYKWPYSQELPLKYLQLRRVKNPFDRDAFFESCKRGESSPDKPEEFYPAEDYIDNATWTPYAKNRFEFEPYVTIRELGGIPFIYGDALVFDGLVVPEKVVYYTAPSYTYNHFQTRSVASRLDYKFEE